MELDYECIDKWIDYLRGSKYLQILIIYANCSFRRIWGKLMCKLDHFLVTLSLLISVWPGVIFLAKKWRGREPSLKSGSVFSFFFFFISLCYKSALLRRWLVDSAQAIRPNLKNLRNSQIMADCTTVVVSACQVGLFRLSWFFMVCVLRGRSVPP